MGRRSRTKRRGSGPAVILVTGGLDDGSENAPLAEELSRSFTTFNYARRGRAESGDTQPYAVEREIEDIEALIAEAGGSARLYGVSSGGALVREAAAAALPPTASRSTRCPTRRTTSSRRPGGSTSRS